MKTYLENEDFSVKVIQKWTRAKIRDEGKEARAAGAPHVARARTNLDGAGRFRCMERLAAAAPIRAVDSSLLDELEKEGSQGAVQELRAWQYILVIREIST
jgi:hypothetical protein